jgi:hypothetical protein
MKLLDDYCCRRRVEGHPVPDGLEMSIVLELELLFGELDLVMPTISPLLETELVLRVT